MAVQHKTARQPLWGAQAVLESIKWALLTGPNRRRLKSAVHSILQALAGLEFRLLRRRYLNLLASARITPFAGGALRHTESPKSDDPDFVTTLKGLGDLVEDAFNCRCRIGFRQAGLFGHFCNQIVLIHFECPIAWNVVRFRTLRLDPRGSADQGFFRRNPAKKMVRRTIEVAMAHEARYP